MVNHSNDQEEDPSNQVYMIKEEFNCSVYDAKFS